jgi:hypothetical protein
MKRTVRAFFGLALWALVAAQPASALTVDPGEVLLAPFSLTAPATGANTLTFRLVSVVSIGVTDLTVELYDGASLLGSVSGVPVNGIAAFVDAGSLWTENAGSTDLSSVRDGSIAGLVRVIPNFSGAGALTADVSSVTSFAVGVGTDDASITPISDVLSIGTASVVPEPGTLALLATALAAGCRVRARKA